MACFVPADFARYPPVFKALLDWYNWRRVSIICDARPVGDFYIQSIFRAQCRDFATVLKPSTRLNQNNSIEYYAVHNIFKDLTTVKGRQEALLEAKSTSRSEFYFDH